MNKKVFTERFAEKANLTNKDAQVAVQAFMDTIVEGVKEDSKIQFTGFGSFELKERAERIGKHPKTKEEILIPASKTIAFKAGKETKEAIK